MEKRTLTSDCNAIFEHYGLENQLAKLSEECKELDEAADIYRREPSEGAKSHLAEEAGDVLVLIRQMVQKGIIDETALCMTMYYKAERQIQRIEEETAHETSECLHP